MGSSVIKRTNLSVNYLPKDSKIILNFAILYFFRKIQKNFT